MPARSVTVQADYELALDQQIGRRVAEHRLQRGLTQSDLAKAVDLTFQQIQKYEKGTNRISVSRLYSLATALDVPLTQLLPDGSETLPEDVAPVRTEFALRKAFDALGADDQALLKDFAAMLASRRARSA